VERNGELNHAEASAEMAARNRNGGNHFPSQFISELA
jgi:hypothetical protein